MFPQLRLRRRVVRQRLVQPPEQFLLQPIPVVVLLGRRRRDRQVFQLLIRQPDGSLLRMDPVTGATQPFMVGVDVAPSWQRLAS